MHLPYILVCTHQRLIHFSRLGSETSYIEMNIFRFKYEYCKNSELIIIIIFTAHQKEGRYIAAYVIMRLFLH